MASTQVKARVLCDGRYGRGNDVITFDSAEDAALAMASGEVDTNPHAVEAANRERARTIELQARRYAIPPTTITTAMPR